MPVSLPRIAALACALTITTAVSTSLAQGCARVQRSDGAVRVYHDVSIRVIDHRAVRIESADRRGTLVISKGACSFSAQLLHCLPYSIVLDQMGKRHVIDFQRGSEYLNPGAASEPLPLSSERLPPHGIVLSLLTARGTYITVTGTVDGMSP